MLKNDSQRVFVRKFKNNKSNKKKILVKIYYFFKIVSQLKISKNWI